MGCGLTKRKEIPKIETKIESISFNINNNQVNRQTHQNIGEESMMEFQTKKTAEKKLIASVIIKGVCKKVEDNYKILNKLGKGAFGSVYKVLHKQTKLQRAMKIIKKESLMLQDDDRTFLKEIEILIDTDHPNIIKIFEYYQDEINYYLITEYVSGGELYDTIANWTNFNEEKAGYLMYQILSAVNYLHSKNIVHRDLKPENILVEKSNSGVNTDPNAINIKLIDFGTCNFYEKDRKLSLRVGTPYYIAPEVLKKNYNEKVDIWSCGVIFYILLVGYPPFNGNSTQEILEAVKEGKYDMKGPEWNRISKEAKDLVSKMLEYDPDIRISAREAMKHEWLNKMFENKISKVVDDGYFGRVLRNIKTFNAREKFQQATLAYIVHFFYSSHEIDDLKKVFQRLDSNGDGMLTFDELKNGFEKIFGKHLSDVEVTNIMEGVDQDHNGYIEYQEFLRATLNRKTLISEENLQLAFEKFDLNNDGKLSKNEILEVLGGTSESEYINKIVDAVDKNKDGEVSYGEFCEMMRKLVYNTMGETILFESPRKTHFFGDRSPEKNKKIDEKIQNGNQAGSDSLSSIQEAKSQNQKKSVVNTQVVKSGKNGGKEVVNPESKLAMSVNIDNNHDKSTLMNNSNLKVDQIDIQNNSISKNSENPK